MGALMDLWNAFWGGLFDFGDYLLSNLDLVAFLILAAIAVLAALFVVTEKEVMHSAFYLALVFLCVGFTYHHPVRVQHHVDQKIHHEEGGRRMTSKKVVVGATVSVVLLAVLVIGIATVDWDDYTSSDVPINNPDIDTDGPDSIYDENGDLKENSLAYTVFEKYGLVLIPLALLMFGAMIGGVCISREEVEGDDSD